MGAMSELDFQLQELRRVMEDGMGEEPRTPKEIAQCDVEINSHDARVTLCKLLSWRNNQLHKPFFSPNVERELWEAKNALDSLLTCIRIDNGEEPPPRSIPVGSNVRALRHG